MKKISLSILLLFGLMAGTWAQTYRYDVFRFTVGVNGGLSANTVGGANSDGKLKMGVGYGADLGLTIFFSQHWGVKFGAGFSAANSEYTFDDITLKNTVVSTNTIDYTSIVKDPKYVFSTYAATLPLMVSYRTDHWYANLGFKLRIPLKGKGDYTVSSTETSAVVRNMGVSVTPNDPIAPVLGCTRTGEQKIDNAAAVRDAWHALIAFDGGYRIETSPAFAWTIGLYGEYALNSPKVEGGNVNFAVQNNGTITKTVQPMTVEKLGYFAFGLKLTFDFGIKAK